MMKYLIAVFFSLLVMASAAHANRCDAPNNLADYKVIEGDYTLSFSDNEKILPGIYVKGDVYLFNATFTGNIYATGTINLSFSLVKGTIYAENKIVKNPKSKITQYACSQVKAPKKSCSNPPNVSDYTLWEGDFKLKRGKRYPTSGVENLYVTGEVELKVGSHFHGNIYAVGEVELRNKAVVDGDVYSEDEVELKGKKSIITGDICEESAAIPLPKPRVCEIPSWDIYNPTLCNGNLEVSNTNENRCNGVIISDFPDNIEVTGNVLVKANAITQSRIHAEGDITVEASVQATGYLYTESCLIIDPSAVISAATCDNCSPSDDFQFEVITPPDALTCEPHSLQVNVRNSDGTIATDYTGLINLTTTPPLGTWSLLNGSGTLIDSDNVDGLGTYQFVSADQGTVELGLFNQIATELSVLISGGGVESDPALITFRPFKLKAEIPEFTTANQPFDMTLTAVGKDASGKGCDVIQEYTGNQNLKFWSSYINPAPADTPAPFGTNVEINQAKIAKDRTTATNQVIDFNNGVATVSVNYPDAGQIQLHTRDDNGIGKPPAGPNQNDELQGSTITIVNPFKLVIDDITATQRNIKSARIKSSGAFIRASVPDYNDLQVDTFDLTAKAIIDCTSAGVSKNCPAIGDDIYKIAPSFSHPKVTLIPSNMSPYKLGSVAYKESLDIALTEGQFVYKNLAYSEVGLFGLQLKALGYIDTGNNIAVDTVKKIGRFYPDYLAFSSFNTIPACNSDFTYLGETAISVNYNMKAYAQGGSYLTENYDQSLGYPVAENFSDQAYVGTLSLNDRLLPSRLLHGYYYQPSEWKSGQYNVLDLKMGIDKTTIPDGPYFDENNNLVDYFIKLSGIDGEKIQINSDTTCSGDSCNLGSLGDLAYGRLQAGNGHGSEFQSVRTAIEATYYDTAQFVPFTRDVCTPLNMAQVSSVPTKTAANEIKVGTTGKTKLSIINSPLIKGKGQFNFSAPKTPGKLDYFIELQTVAPWLLDAGNAVVCPESSASNEDCISGYVEFGLFRGNDRIINRLQTFN